MEGDEEGRDGVVDWADVFVFLELVLPIYEYPLNFLIFLSTWKDLLGR